MAFAALWVPALPASAVPLADPSPAAGRATDDSGPAATPQATTPADPSAAATGHAAGTTGTTPGGHTPTGQGAGGQSPTGQLPGATGQATAGAPADLPAGVLSAMQRDLGLTADEARTRVANEHRAGTLATTLGTDLGSSFGGAWVTGKKSALTVATTDGDQRAAITRAGARAAVVRHSLRDLDDAKAALDRAASRAHTPAATAHAWYVDPRTNRVVVQSARPAAASAFVRASGVRDGLVTVVRSADQPRPYADLRGGDAYYINGTSRCSIGFPVTKNGHSGFVTAGHCGDVGDTTTGYNQVAQGVFQGSRFPGNDYAWVQTNSGWTARPLVRGPNGTDVTVAGSQQVPVGASVCRSGSSSGWHCGTIQAHDTSVTYPQGTVSGVTRTNVCAEPGDSGGSFISGNQAQGVTSGGSGDCTSGGTTYYQPVNPILQAYGLTLKTG